jgi:hypothetical protein
MVLSWGTQRGCHHFRVTYHELIMSSTAFLQAAFYVQLWHRPSLAPILLRTSQLLMDKYLDPGVRAPCQPGGVAHGGRHRHGPYWAWECKPLHWTPFQLASPPNSRQSLSLPSSSSPLCIWKLSCPPPALSLLDSKKQIEVQGELGPVSENPIAIKIAVTGECNTNT